MEAVRAAARPSLETIPRLTISTLSPKTASCPTAEPAWRLSDIALTTRIGPETSCRAAHIDHALQLDAACRQQHQWLVAGHSKRLVLGERHTRTGHDAVCGHLVVVLIALHAKVGVDLDVVAVLAPVPRLRRKVGHGVEADSDERPEA